MVKKILFLLFALGLGITVSLFPQQANAATAPQLGIAANAATVYLTDLSPAAVDQYFSQVEATGSQWVRFRFDFNNIEPSRGQYNWERWDDLTTAANRHGLRVVGILISAPAWAVPEGCDPDALACAPRPADFGTFAGAAAARYNGSGDTGKVDAWEIWNEPNCGDFYPRTPAAYTALVKAAYSSIKSSSSATVLAGGSGACITNTSQNNWNTRDWLVGMYANGAKGYFDGLTHHPYCWIGTNAAESQICPLQSQPWSNWTAMHQDYPDNNSYSIDGRSLRSILAANGNGSLPIWLTEFGAPTATQPYLSNSDQDRQLRDAYNWLSQQPAGYYGPLFWYELKDECTPDQQTGTNCNSTEGFYGLSDYYGNRKLAYNTFRSFATKVSVTSLTASGSFVPGADVTVKLSLLTPGMTVDRLVVAARDQNNANVDFPDIPTHTLAGVHNFTVSRSLPAGTYRYWVAYYKDGVWTELAPTNTFTVAYGTGLKATYYNNANFTGTTRTRTDATVNFNWGTAAPISGIAKDTFSVRWTGKIAAPATAAYTFSLTSDDGMRLWVNGTQIINDWTKHTTRTKSSAPVTLEAGRKYDIKIEYYDNTGAATARLLWSRPGVASATVPAVQLYPN